MSVVKNRTQIYSGTDYLGTARDPEFLDKLSKALETDGLHYGGSRWANNCPSIYNVAERFLADFYGVEETLLFSSGSMAAYFTQKIILGAGEVFIMNDLHPGFVSFC